jgi:zeaxanthin glucosyltransferase
MARFLFATSPESGHLNPLLGILQHLDGTGHALACYSPSRASDRLEAAGIRIRTYGDASRPAPVDSAALQRRLRDPRWIDRFLQIAMFDPVPRQVEDLRAAIRDFHPDVVAVDPTLYAGAIAATLENRPWAAINHSLLSIAPPTWRCPHLDAFDRLEPVRRALLSTFGVSLTFRGSDVRSPWLNTVFTTEALGSVAVERQFPTFLVGAPQSGSRGDQVGFDWHRVPSDLPLVYVAFGGVVSPSPATLGRIAEALALLPVHAIVAAKDQVDRVTWPDNVVVVPWAPQREVLARARAMVTHGGAGSVTECLTAGVPMLVVPLVAEQSIQARLVTERGCGLTLDPEELTVEACRGAIAGLLAPGSKQATQARVIGESLRSRNGSVEAGSLLIRLAITGQPCTNGPTEPAR